MWPRDDAPAEAIGRTRCAQANALVGCGQTKPLCSTVAAEPRAGNALWWFPTDAMGSPRVQQGLEPALFIMPLVQRHVRLSWVVADGLALLWGLPYGGALCRTPLLQDVGSGVASASCGQGLRRLWSDLLWSAKRRQ